MKMKQLLTLLVAVASMVAFARPYGPGHGGHHGPPMHHGGGWRGATPGPHGWHGAPAHGNLYRPAPNHHPGWRDCYRPVYSYGYGYRGWGYPVAVPSPVYPSVVPATVYPYGYGATVVTPAAPVVTTTPVVTYPSTTIVQPTVPAAGVGVRAGPVAIGAGVGFW